MDDTTLRGASPNEPHAPGVPKDAVIITADDPTDLAALTELINGLRGVRAEIVEFPPAPGTLGGHEVLQVIGETSGPLAVFLNAWIKSKVTRLKITVRGTTIDLRSTEADEMLPKIEALLAAAAPTPPAPALGETAPALRPAAGPPEGRTDVGI